MLSILFTFLTCSLLFSPISSLPKSPHPPPSNTTDLNAYPPVTCDPLPLKRIPSPQLIDCVLLLEQVDTAVPDPESVYTFTNGGQPSFDSRPVPLSWKSSTCAATLLLDKGDARDDELWLILGATVERIVEKCIRGQPRPFGGRTVLGINKNLLMTVHPSAWKPYEDTGRLNWRNETGLALNGVGSS